MRQKAKWMAFKMWFDLKHSLVYEEVSKLCYCSSTKYRLEFAIDAWDAHASDIIKISKFSLVRRNATIANILSNSLSLSTAYGQIFLIFLRETDSNRKLFRLISCNSRLTVNVSAQRMNEGSLEREREEWQCSTLHNIEQYKFVEKFFFHLYESGKSMGAHIYEIRVNKHN